MMQTNSSIELEPGSAVCRSDDTPGVVVKINMERQLNLLMRLAPDGSIVARFASATPFG